MSDEQTPPPAPPMVETTPPPAPPVADEPAPARGHFVRVRQIPSAVVHPEHGAFVTPRAGDRYPADDPLVVEYPWLFEDQDVAVPEDAAESVRIGPVEDATANPGQKRNTRRPRG